MAEKELRRMSRPELIEIIYALKSNEESLQKKNAHLEEQLNDRTIQISEAGSIAEAALQLNDIFSTAQIAADDYLTSIKAANVSMEEEQKAAAKEAERVVAEANAEAARIMTMAKEKADNTLSEAEAASQHMTDTAQKKAEVLKAQSEDKAQTCVELAQKQSQDMITAAEQKRDQLEEACREKSEETQKSKIHLRFILSPIFITIKAIGC